MFEILMYLFENYMDGSAVLKTDQDTLVSELEMIGFNKGEIGLALDWLDGLSRIQEDVRNSPLSVFPSMRHYSDEEKEHIPLEGRGFLLYLEQLRILDPVTREIVIDRLMAFLHHPVDLGRIKWVVLIALFNQPDKRSALTLLQDMILSNAYGPLH